MHRQPEPTDRAEVNKLATAVDEALVEAMQTRYLDTTPLPPIGTAPPVAQPGRAAMSQQATDASVLMLAGGATTFMVGGTAAGLMYVSQYADLGVCIAVFSAPAVLILALGRLVKRAGQAMPPEIHNHYNAPVEQHSQTVTNENKLWGKSSTNL